MQNKLRLTLLIAVLPLAIHCHSAEYTVLQWNIWQEGTQVEGGYNAIVNEISRLKPDFVTLSEVRNYNNIDFTARLVADLSAKGDTFYTCLSYDTGVLSKYPIESFDTIFPLVNDHGSIYRIRTTAENGDKFAIYTAHLDYLDCAYYELRGYSGNTWEKCPIPTSLEEIIFKNDLSQRDDAIRLFINAARTDIEEGRTVIIGGDFNEPSWQDWTEETASIRDHNGFIVPWTVSKLLTDNGFIDAYRELYPNPTDNPGFTFPSANKDVETKRLTWAPESDERERIDFIYIKSPSENESTITEAYIFGPRESIEKSQLTDDGGHDKFILPSGVWPTDHKGLLIKLKTEK